MQIDFYYRTFGELKANKELGFNDPYNIMASLNPKMREAVLHNPSGYRDDEVCQILALDGDVVVGATNPFSGRLLINGEIVPCQNDSYLFTHKNYRKDSIGGELFMILTKLHPSKNNYYAGISQMAMGLYKALKYTVFEFPRMIYLRKSRSVIQVFFHSSSWWIKPFIWMADAFLCLHRLMVKLHNIICYDGYILEEVKDCPKEIETIVKQDCHPYMEYHDKAWFDWSLRYSISEDMRTCRRLFVVKNEDQIEAFFLIKQEFFEKASSRGFKKVYLGSVMEWGISKLSRLTERDIVMLSLGTFDDNVDGIQYATDNSKVKSQLRWWLFVEIGMANIGFKLKTIKSSEINKMSKWRIRLAGSDTVLN